MTLMFHSSTDQGSCLPGFYFICYDGSQQEFTMKSNWWQNITFLDGLDSSPFSEGRLVGLDGELCAEESFLGEKYLSRPPPEGVLEPLLGVAGDGVAFTGVALPLSGKEIVSAHWNNSITIHPAILFVIYFSTRLC